LGKESAVLVMALLVLKPIQLGQFLLRCIFLYNMLWRCNCWNNII